MPLRSAHLLIRPAFHCANDVISHFLCSAITLGSNGEARTVGVANASRIANAVDQPPIRRQSADPPKYPIARACLSSMAPLCTGVDPSRTVEISPYAVLTVFKLDVHFRRFALVFALANVGSNIEARIPMIAMTTNSSIRVNPFCVSFFIFRLGLWRADFPVSSFPGKKHRAIVMPAKSRQNLMKNRCFIGYKAPDA